MDQEVTCFDENLKKQIIGNIKTRKQIKDESVDILNQILQTMKTQNLQIQAQNLQIQGQNDDIQAQNLQVQAQNLQIHAQNDDIQAQNLQIHALYKDIQAQNHQIQAQKEINEALEKDVLEIKAKISPFNKRKNLEFFLRAYFGIPFKRKITNQTQILYAMFEELRENFRLNQNKIIKKVKDLKIICFRTVTLSCKNGKFHEKYTSDEKVIGEILFKIIEFFRKQKDFTIHNSIIFNAFDDSKKLYGDLCEKVHEKEVILSVDLFFYQATDLKMVPFIVLSDFYYPIQKKITKELASDSEKYEYLDLMFDAWII
jgi:hypothetical protein